MNLFLGIILVCLVICGFDEGSIFLGNAKHQSTIILVLLIIWISLLIYIYFRFFSTNRKIMVKKYGYHRDIPNKYGPEIVGYLLTYKRIKPEYLTASIMELIRRKIFIAIEQPDDSVIIRNNDTGNKQIMSSSEKYLKEWLINSVGNGLEFNSNDLYISSHDASKKIVFDSSFEEWSKIVIEQGKQEGFYDGNILLKNKSVITFIFLNVGILYNFLGNLLNNMNNISLTISLFLTFILLVILLSVLNFDFVDELRTTKGNEEYKKWMGLKNFILDYSNFNNKDIKDVSLWEEYLVYATALGITDNINFKLDINDIGTSVDAEHHVLVAHHIIQRKIKLILSDYKKRK